MNDKEFEQAVEAEEQLNDESLAKVAGGRITPVWKSDGATYGTDGKWHGGNAKGARERAQYGRTGKTRGVR